MKTSIYSPANHRGRIRAEMNDMKCNHCSDYTIHLQKYLIHGEHSYNPGTNEIFNLEEEFKGVDTTNVDAVALRLVNLGQAEQVKALFGGLIDSMCTGVKTYIDQVQAWEAQYNFIGM
ncbi:hypothetical protein ACOMHN_026954 [Nucella lapillus]